LDTLLDDRTLVYPGKFYTFFAFYRHHMKCVGKMQVMSVKKFCEERSGIEILAKSAAFAPASSSGATFPACRQAGFVTFLD